MTGNTIICCCEELHILHKAIKNNQNVGIAEQQKVGIQGRDDSITIKQLSIQPPYRHLGPQLERGM